MKKFLLLVLVLLVGLYAGYQLPRGPALFAWLSNLRGDKVSDYHYLKSAAQFDQLRAVIEQSEQMVLRESTSEQEAVEGLRWILRVVAESAEVAADADPRQPFFQRMDTPARKVGGDNPDGEYDLAAIDGRYDYKITGNIGSVSYLSFTISGGQGMKPRYMAGYIGDRDLQADQDGNFTLWLTKTKPAQPGAWVQIPGDASSILVRQYIADRQKERLATYDIQAIGDNLPAPEPPSDALMARNIAGTAYAALKLTTLHKTVLPEMLQKPNTFFRATAKNLGGEISGSENLYQIMHFKIDDDEALIVTVEPPKTRYWNLTLETIWHETPDYLHLPVSRTLSNSTPDPDGKIRFVVADKDPGVKNWIDTVRHHRGFLTFRWLDVADIGTPGVEKVKFAALHSFLDGHPAGQ